MSRNDRHRQLINANVYEKETQNRVKAIEETRQKRLKGRKTREKTLFNNYLRHQAAASSASTAGTPNGVDTGRNEIVIEGMRFRVADGGKKLLKSTGKIAFPESCMTRK